MVPSVVCFMLGPTGIILLLFMQSVLRKDFSAFRKRLKYFFKCLTIYVPVTGFEVILG
jgi:hypothetical protein